MVSSEVWFQKEQEIDLSYINKQQLEQNQNILLNSASASALNDYDDMYLDIFSDAEGYDGTIDTDNTDATFEDNLYYNYDSNSSTANYSDTSENSAAGTYHNDDVTLLSIDCNDYIYESAVSVKKIDGSCAVFIKYIYEDGTTAKTGSYGSGSSYVDGTDLNPYPHKKVITLECYADFCSSNEEAVKVKNLYGYSLTVADKIVQTNSQEITANPIGHQLFCHGDNTENLTYDISFDGGVNWITNQLINTKNTTVREGNSMILKLNLNGDTSVSINDYSIMLFY